MIAQLVVASAAAFLSTMLGGLFALRYRSFHIALYAFTGGVLIAVAIVDILPEAFEMAISISIPMAGLILFAASGFALLLVLERGHHSGVSQRSARRQKLYGLIAGSEMAVHSLLEGVAIGVAFALSPSVGLVIALAVVLHDASDGLSLTSVMLKSGNSRRASLAMLTVEASATGLGIGLTFFFEVPADFVTVILAFIGGGLLYIGAIEMLPHAVRNSDRLSVPAVSGTSGFALICLIATVV